MSICDGSTGSNLKVEYSVDPTLVWNDAGHTWNEVTGVTGLLDVSGGEKPVGEKKVFNGVIAGIGQAGLLTVNLDVVFENSTTSFLEFITDTYDGTGTYTCFWLRWAYNAGASGALRRTAKVALAGDNPYTGGDPNSGDPVSRQLPLVVDDGIYRDTV